MCIIEKKKRLFMILLLCISFSAHVPLFLLLNWPGFSSGRIQNIASLRDLICTAHNRRFRNWRGEVIELVLNSWLHIRSGLSYPFRPPHRQAHNYTHSSSMPLALEARRPFSKVSDPASSALFIFKLNAVPQLWIKYSSTLRSTDVKLTWHSHAVHRVWCWW